MQVWSLGQEDPLEKEMATHCNSLTWGIPGTEEPSGLQSIRSQKSPTQLSNKNSKEETYREVHRLHLCLETEVSRQSFKVPEIMKISNFSTLRLNRALTFTKSIHRHCFFASSEPGKLDIISISLFIWENWFRRDMPDPESHNELPQGWGQNVIILLVAKFFRAQVEAWVHGGE